MTRDDRTARIAALIRRYKPTVSAASFRNEFRAVVSAAVDSGTISQQEADLLVKAASYLEQWVCDSPPAPADAWTQWAEIYQEGREGLPDSIFEALLARFPKSAKRSADWASLVFAGAGKRLLRALVTRGLLRKADLIQIAKTRPGDLYRSAALDVLLDYRVAAPRAVWDPLAKGEARPAGLLPGNEGLVASFDFDGARDAEQWLVEFLAAAPVDVRRAVLRSVLARAEAAPRLASYLSPPCPTRRTKQSKQRPAAAAEGRVVVLTDWVGICAEAIERGASEAPAASVALALMQAGLASNPAILPNDALADVSAAADRAAEHAVVLALRTAEAVGAEAARPYALTVRGHELYRAVQEYLRLLPLGVKDDASPERALRFERYQGRREVVQALLSALDYVSDAGPLRDAVEAVLFNTGVRFIGALGEQVSFDTHTHQPEVSGLFPGDPAVVTRLGRRLGDEDGGIVLVKARVRPLRSEAATDRAE